MTNELNCPHEWESRGSNHLACRLCGNQPNATQPTPEALSKIEIGSKVTDNLGRAFTVRYKTEHSVLITIDKEHLLFADNNPDYLVSLDCRGKLVYSDNCGYEFFITFPQPPEGV
jgi:hypothetical protein